MKIGNGKEPGFPDSLSRFNCCCINLRLLAFSRACAHHALDINAFVGFKQGIKLC